MSELPKFAAWRLAKSAAPEEHPPSDLLAAFAEQSLSGAERDRLLSHLATCAPCREVIWCAMPESEATQNAFVRPAAGRWSWFQVWRWAGVAAGVAVIAGVALLFRGGPGPAGEKMVSAPKPAVMAQERENQAQNARQAAPAKEAVRAPALESEARLKAPAPRPQNAPRLQNKDTESQLAAALPRRDLDDKIVPQNELAKSEVGGRLAAASRAAPAAAPAPAAPAALAAPASTADAGVAIASNTGAGSAGKKKLAPPTRWMLSPEGALQRSTDSGKNWQTVPFESNTVFRALAVVGPRIWAGGKGGVLYFSADDGNQWQRLATPAAGTALSEDITSLSFQDAQHGSLTTAGGQTWTTSDGGLTWQKP